MSPLWQSPLLTKHKQVSGSGQHLAGFSQNPSAPLALHLGLREPSTLGQGAAAGRVGWAASAGVEHTLELVVPPVSTQRLALTGHVPI